MYKLQLLTRTGDCIEICGCEEVIDAAYAKVSTFLDAVDGTFPDRSVEVDGFWDSADRAECRVTALLDHIIGMRMFRL